MDQCLYILSSRVVVDGEYSISWAVAAADEELDLEPKLGKS